MTQIFKPGFTSVLKPLDVSINKPIKGIMREEWRKWFEDSNPVLTKKGNRQRPYYGDILSMVSNVYDQLHRNHDMIIKVIYFFVNNK